MELGILHFGLDKTDQDVWNKIDKDMVWNYGFHEGDKYADLASDDCDKGIIPCTYDALVKRGEMYLKKYRKRDTRRTIRTLTGSELIPPPVGHYWTIAAKAGIRDTAKFLISLQEE